MAGKNSDNIRCSFCNKTQSQVKKMIAGPAGVYICDECVSICSDIVEEEYEEAEAENEPEMEINLLKPVEIKEFLDDLVETAREKGYASTMYGRRRPVPELKSSNFMQRSFGERVAMNSPIQGTAADIIKIAMNRVYKRLKSEGKKSRLVLQVHDELLIETRKEELTQVARILEEEMKGAASLQVELEVDMHEGSSWYEAK